MGPHDSEDQAKPYVAAPEPKAPLGVGTIIAESFSILIKNIFRVILVSSVPMALFVVPIGLMLSSTGAINLENPAANWPMVAAYTVTSLLTFCAAISLISAAVTKLTYDAKHQKTRSLREIFGPSLAAAPAIVLLGLAIGVALLALQASVFVLGFATTLLSFVALPVFFVIYLWAIATFSLMPSAAVIEKRGLRSLGRSMELTKGYRLPVLGTMFLAGLCSIAVQLVFSIATVLLTALASLVSDTLSGILSFASSLVTFGLVIGFICIVACLVYLRLREVKEGVGIEQIEQIFD